MAVTDPVAISFCDKFARPLADKMAQEYFACKAAVARWNAIGGATLIPNTATVVQDTASPNGTTTAGGDGRPGLTGTMVNNLITRATEKITDFEATTNAKLNTVLVVSPNPASNGIG
jgi:hypothetical protein